jgi:hypothetical protein
MDSFLISNNPDTSYNLLFMVSRISQFHEKQPISQIGCETASAMRTSM